MYGSFIPAAKDLCCADENTVREYFAKKVPVLGAVANISPVAVLKDDGLPGDVVQAGIHQLHIQQKQLSANQAVAVEAKPRDSQHQEVGPLVLVQAQEQLRFEESVISQQRLRTKNSL